MTARYIVGDCFDVLATLADDSVDLIVTSPPFLALRSYLPADHEHKSKELGSEATPGAFIDRLLDVVEACARVLAPHGSLVFELGDTYAGSGGAGGDYGDEGWRAGQLTYRQQQQVAPKDSSGPRLRDRRANAVTGNKNRDKRPGWPLDKSKVLIPQLFAIALAYGFNPLTGRQTEPWRVRNTVAWCRPNPPVGRDGDKFRPATSFLTIACKARDRFWDGDAVRTPIQHPNVTHTLGTVAATRGDAADPPDKPLENNPAGAPLLDYWVLPTHPFRGAHYATWPPDLVVPLVKSMCPARVCRVCGKPSTRIVESTQFLNGKPKPEGKQYTATKVPQRTIRDKYEHLVETDGQGTFTKHVETLGWSDCGHNDWRAGHVLDPFGGSGTTAAVATGHGFDCTLIDLDERNAWLARERVGMLLEIETFGSPPAAETLTIEPRF